MEVRGMKLFSLKKSIGENLLHYIRLNGYTKTSFSKLTGISRPTLNQILNGDSPSPNIYEEQMKKITDALGLPLDYFTQLPSHEQEKWLLPATQYSDRFSGSERDALTRELLADLDELLSVAAFYVKG